jgi:triacylglycerol esterase/lipase EstA (alpha/beta hydrolase family)
MRSSAAEIGAYIEQVRAVTGAPKVNIVGHSEGTTVAAYYMKFLGGNTRVRHFVGFGSNYKGTTLYGLNELARALPGITEPLLDGLCDACNEYLPPSSFLTDLNRGGVSVPGPTYTNIVTRYDAVVVPYTSGILSEPGVTNIVLQDRCWFDASGHLALAIDPNVTSHILWALNGKTTPRPLCVPFIAPA